MVPEETLREIVRLLKENAPARKVILFASHGRDGAGPLSDIDLLVVETEVHDRLAEMRRLRRLLRPLHLPIDSLVVSGEVFDYWRETPGNVCHEASTDGRILYEAA